MNRKETRLLVESWRRLMSEGNEDPLYMYTAITPESIDSVMKNGLLNAVTLIKDEDKVKMARPDKKVREKFIANVKKHKDDDSYNGISVFFGAPDWDKITEDHFIKKWKLQIYKIDLGRFLEDYPESWVKGVELIPYIAKYNHLSDKEYDKKMEEMGYDLSKGWDDAREREISVEEIRKYGDVSPKEMWQWYDVEEHTGKYYAANVPHAFIMSEIGKIPPAYIEANPE
jgi:hypothetical protein